MQIPDLLIHLLKKEGIEYIFGIPGGGVILDLIDSASKEGLEYILTTHEGSASIMAAVYGQLTGKPGVCLATMAPGLTNSISGAAYAYLERTPMLLITNRHADLIYEESFSQNIDQVSLLRPITKYAVTVKSESAEKSILHALKVAKEPLAGPVFLELPNNPGSADLIVDHHIKSSPEAAGSPDSSESGTLNNAVSLIDGAKRPLIIAGHVAGIFKLTSQLAELAEHLKSPVFTTLKAKGLFPENNRLSAGIYAGAKIEESLIEQADLLISIGLDGPELLPGLWKHSQPLININIPAVNSSFYKPAVELIGDIAENISALTQKTTGPKIWDISAVESYRDLLRNAAKCSERGFSLAQVIQTVNNTIPADSIITTDVGSHCTVVNYLYESLKPHTYFTTKGFSTMAFAVPAAIAAQLVFRSRKIVSFNGDGGFLMQINELETAVRYKLPIIFIVFCDSCMDLIRIKQKQKGYSCSGVFLSSPDYAKIGAGFGALGFQVSSEHELSEALSLAMGQHEKPAVIQINAIGFACEDTLNLLRGKTK